MQTLDRHPVVGDILPGYGTIAEIKDVGHESYAMRYTFANGQVAYLQRVRITDAGATWYDPGGFGID